MTAARPSPQPRTPRRRQSAIGTAYSCRNGSAFVVYRQSGSDRDPRVDKVLGSFAREDDATEYVELLNAREVSR